MRFAAYLLKQTEQLLCRSIFATTQGQNRLLLHTCAGISEHDESWPIGWFLGYVVLTVDSLTPRSQKYMCDGSSGWTAPWSRALDAYGTKRYLSTRPFLNPNRVAVMEMSHG